MQAQRKSWPPLPRGLPVIIIQNMQTVLHPASEPLGPCVVHQQLGKHAVADSPCGVETGQVQAQEFSSHFPARHPSFHHFVLLSCDHLRQSPCGESKGAAVPNPTLPVVAVQTPLYSGLYPLDMHPHQYPNSTSFFFISYLLLRREMFKISIIW